MKTDKRRNHTQYRSYTQYKISVVQLYRSADDVILIIIIQKPKSHEI